MKLFVAYILYSVSLDRYYYGHTKNLDQRLKQHNWGKVRATKGGRPWQVHYIEYFETKTEAAQRERFFKSIAGYV